MVLMGEIVGCSLYMYSYYVLIACPQELDLEDRPLPWMRQATVEEVLAAAKAEEDAKKVYQKQKEQVLHDKRGFSSEGAEYDAYT